jgi:hypothetical protein
MRGSIAVTTQSKIDAALLALPLLMLRLTANHTHNTVALNDFTVAAHLFNGCTNFHYITP